LIAKTLPVPVTPEGAFTIPVTFSIGASSTFMSVTRTALTLNSSGKLHAVSSYGRFCGSLGAQY
jgi:hypothetical protein